MRRATLAVGALFRGFYPSLRIAEWSSFVWSRAGGEEEWANKEKIPRDSIFFTHLFIRLWGHLSYMLQQNTKSSLFHARWKYFSSLYWNVWYFVSTRRFKARWIAMSVSFTPFSNTRAFHALTALGTRSIGNKYLRPIPIHFDRVPNIGKNFIQRY